MKKVQLFSIAFLFAVVLAAISSFSSKHTLVQSKKLTLSGNITVSGGGSFEELGAKTTYTFNAIRQVNGSTTGHLVLHFRAAGGTLLVKLDCLRLFGNNQATMSGVITKVLVKGEELPPPFIYVGGRVSFTVQDNGEGKAGSPDLLSDIGELVSGVPASCLDEWPLYLATDGNVQINR